MKPPWHDIHTHKPYFVKNTPLFGTPTSGDRLAVPLSYEETRDIYQMYQTRPVIQMAIRTFQQHLFSTLPEITWGNNNIAFVLKPDLMDRLIERYYMPWLRNIHFQCALYGIAAYYFKYIDLVPVPPPDDQKVFMRDYTFVPVVPPMGSGHIETYIDKHNEQQFQWRWSSMEGTGKRQNQLDTGFFFVVSTAPNIYGSYQSPLSALLTTWRHLSFFQMSNRQIIDRQINPRHIIQWKPDITKATGQRASSYVEGADQSIIYPGGPQLAGVERPIEYGGNEAALIEAARMPIASLHQFRERQLDSRDRHPTAEAYVGSSTAIPPCYFTYSSEHDDKGALSSFLMQHPNLAHTIRPGQGLPPNTHILLPNEELITIPPPANIVNILDMEEHFDRLASVTVNVPLDMIVNFGASHHGSGGTDPSSMQAFYAKRIENASQFYSFMLENMLRALFAPSVRVSTMKNQDHFRRRYGRVPTGSELLQVDQVIQIKVIFPRAPDISLEEIFQYYRHRFIDEDATYRYAMNLIGIKPEETMPKDVKKALRNLYSIEKEDIQAQSGKTKNTKPASKSKV